MDGVRLKLEVAVAAVVAVVVVAAVAAVVAGIIVVATFVNIGGGRTDGVGESNWVESIGESMILSLLPLFGFL